MFHAVHVEHQRLDQADEIAAFAARNGLDRSRFTALFNSFAVQAKVRRATQLYADHDVNEVPTLVVQGATSRRRVRPAAAPRRCTWSTG